MRILLPILMALMFSGQAGAVSVEQDIEQYIVIFNGDRSQHSANAETLTWMGLSDTRLFDIIERRLLQDYPIRNDDLREKQRISWYLRALGFSGQEKYLPTLAKFVKAPEPRHDMAARIALKELPVYRDWNPVISNRASFDAKLSDDANRAANMLRHHDFMLKRLGAKRVYYEGHRDDALLDLLAAELRASYLTQQTENGDAVAWMVKALASSKKQKYRPLVEQVLAGAGLPAVRDHAKKALAFYAKP